ncbi:MAG: hypothetical protein ACO1SX_04555 [Actinomycetota bacterium]
MDTTCASGARRSSAALAVVNSLGAVDLVAAIVAEDARAGVTAAVRKELEAHHFHRFDVENPGGVLPESAKGQRSVYLWGDVDSEILRDPAAFQLEVERLCSALARSGSGATGVRRAVLIGGAALLERLDCLAQAVNGGMRYRYILVQ